MFKILGLGLFYFFVSFNSEQLRKLVIYYESLGISKFYYYFRLLNSSLLEYFCGVKEHKLINEAFYLTIDLGSKDNDKGFKF